MNITDIARICHEANRALQIVNGDPSIPVAPPWDDEDEGIRASAVAGVQFLVDNPLANPIDSHQSWADFKVSEGWVYGPVKDLDAKTHPCLVPYHDLPEQDRIKDSLFSGIVRALT